MKKAATGSGGIRLRPKGRGGAPDAMIETERNEESAKAMFNHWKAVWHMKKATTGELSCPVAAEPGWLLVPPALFNREPVKKM